jgi:hypothetical protein
MRPLEVVWLLAQSPSTMGVGAKTRAQRYLFVRGKGSDDLFFLRLGRLKRSSDRPSSAATWSNSAGGIFSSRGGRLFVFAVTHVAVDAWSRFQLGDVRRRLTRQRDGRRNTAG